MTKAHVVDGGGNEADHRALKTIPAADPLVDLEGMFLTAVARERGRGVWDGAEHIEVTSR